MSGRTSPTGSTPNTQTPPSVASASYATELLDTAYRIVTWVGTSALAAHLMGIHPAAGAIFGVGNALLSIPVQKFVAPSYNRSSDVVKGALGLALPAAYIALPTAATRAAGFSLPILTGAAPLLMILIVSEIYIFKPIANRAYQWMSHGPAGRTYTPLT